MSERIKETRENWRVEVIPDEPWILGRDITEKQIHQKWRDAANEVMEQIKRHVDGINRHGTEVKWDTRRECAACGSRWTEESDTFNGGCCDEDMKHEPPQPGADLKLLAGEGE